MPKRNGQHDEAMRRQKARMKKAKAKSKKRSLQPPKSTRKTRFV